MNSRAPLQAGAWDRNGGRAVILARAAVLYICVRSTPLSKEKNHAAGKDI
jgi:hypothetical protein